MKVLYLAMVLMLSCIVPAHSISMQKNYKAQVATKCFMVLVKVEMAMARI